MGKGKWARSNGQGRMGNSKWPNGQMSKGKWASANGQAQRGKRKGASAEGQAQMGGREGGESPWLRTGGPSRKWAVCSPRTAPSPDSLSPCFSAPTLLPFALVHISSPIYPCFRAFAHLPSPTRPLPISPCPRPLAHAPLLYSPLPVCPFPCAFCSIRISPKYVSSLALAHSAPVHMLQPNCPRPFVLGHMP